MTTCTTPIRSLLCPALETVGADERAKDRYAMAAAIGFLLLWFKDLDWDSKTPISIPADQVPPGSLSAEMVKLTTWWAFLSESASDEALFVEVAKQLHSALDDLDLD
jgi:hypothetical protein